MMSVAIRGESGSYNTDSTRSSKIGSVAIRGESGSYNTGGYRLCRGFSVAIRGESGVSHSGRVGWSLAHTFKAACLSLNAINMQPLNAFKKPSSVGEYYFAKINDKVTYSSTEHPILKWRKCGCLRHQNSWSPADDRNSACKNVDESQSISINLRCKTWRH